MAVFRVAYELKITPQQVRDMPPKDFLGFLAYLEICDDADN